MAKKKKFSQPGETEEKIRWNKSKTRKWLIEYTVMETRPSSKRKNAKQKSKPETTTVKKAKTKKTTKTKRARAKNNARGR